MKSMSASSKGTYPDLMLSRADLRVAGDSPPAASFSISAIISRFVSQEIGGIGISDQIHGFPHDLVEVDDVPLLAEVDGDPVAKSPGKRALKERTHKPVAWRIVDVQYPLPILRVHLEIDLV